MRGLYRVTSVSSISNRAGTDLVEHKADAVACREHAHDQVREHGKFMLLRNGHEHKFKHKDNEVDTYSRTHVIHTRFTKDAPPCCEGGACR